MDAGLFPDSKQLGRYRIVKRLGGGATSEVLLAVYRGPHGFERVVALKRLLAQYEGDDSMVRMLASEAVAYSRLTHPAIVRLYDFFEHDGHAVLALEYVDGLSLAQLQSLLAARRDLLGDPAAFFIASRVFAALAAAHAARDPRSGEFSPVIHRAVSPGSVLLPWDGFVKLGDFGFAKVKGLTDDKSNTRPGHLKGTFGYMAPEQAMGERVTPRTDVYAGCLLLRELLLAAPTFPAPLPELEFLRAMAEAELPPIEQVRSGISPALADAMRRGLARDPEARTLTAAEMIRVLKTETDLGLAQLSVADALARVRPSDTRASTPPHGVRAIDAPSSGTMRFERMHMPPEAIPSDVELGEGRDRDSDSHPTLRHDTPSRAVMVGRTGAPPAHLAELEQRPPTVLLAAGAAAVSACIAFAVLLRTPAPAHVDAASLSSAVAETALAPLPPPPLPPDPPAPSAPAPAPAPTLGDLLTPASARSHRVFVDGHYAAARSGETLHVHCGKHTVRIGSSGREQRVDVPCGGQAAVSAR